MNLSPSQERAVAALRPDWPDTESFVLWAPYGLFAFDRSRKLPLKPVTDYFVQAITTVRENKKRYAEAEARIRSRPHVPENPFGYVPDFGGEDD